MMDNCLLPSILGPISGYTACELGFDLVFGEGAGDLSISWIQIPSHRPADSLTGHQASNICGKVLYSGWRRR